MLRLVLVAGLLSLTACAPSMGSPSTLAQAPEFSLLDVNPASSSSGQQVGPAALRGRVSGWYFTHSS